jgi:hypothetical protein
LNKKIFEKVSDIKKTGFAVLKMHIPGLTITLLGLVKKSQRISAAFDLFIISLP